MTDPAALPTQDDGEHAEIWLEPKCAENDCNGRLWCYDDIFESCGECGDDPVRYVRADLYDAAQAENRILRAKLTALGYGDDAAPPGYDG
jgi:hypothetical protein